MRKILILLLIVAMIATMFIGCAQKTGFGSTSADTNGNGLRDDVELKILKAHHKKNGKKKVRRDNHEIRYYGKYNGAYIVGLSCGNSISTGERPLEDFDSIPNSMLFSSDMIGTIAWYKGKLRSLLSLFDSGVLSEENINEIRAKLKEQWWKS